VCLGENCIQSSELAQRLNSVKAAIAILKSSRSLQPLCVCVCLSVCLSVRMCVCACVFRTLQWRLPCALWRYPSGLPVQNCPPVTLLPNVSVLFLPPTSCLPWNPPAGNALTCILFSYLEWRTYGTCVSGETSWSHRHNFIRVATCWFFLSFSFAPFTCRSHVVVTVWPKVLTPKHLFYHWYMYDPWPLNHALFSLQSAANAYHFGFGSSQQPTKKVGISN
jgi:hypothetical protein